MNSSCTTSLQCCSRRLFAILILFSFSFACLHAQSAGHGVAAALLNVVQHDTSNNVTSVTVTSALSVNDFRVRDGSNRGDFFVQIGEGFSDDAENGALMTCVAENGRNNSESAYPGINYCTTATDFSKSGGTTGGYFIPVSQASTGDEFNINVAAAYFPYSDWLGGNAFNSGQTNGGVNDTLVASPGIVLGTHYVNIGGGTNIVNLSSFGVDSRTDGVLLVAHGRNEDNYALSQVNSNNGTWTVYVKDNGTDAGSYEQDPVAFVFIPKTNTSVISGRFRGNGTRLIYSGPTPQYSVTNTATGTWRLTINGHSPNTGVLIISAEGGLSQNQDNIVSYEPDGDGWIIQSRDLPNNGLQTPSGGNEPVASFVFIPAAATVSLISPSDGAQAVFKSPTLQVAISNSTPGNLTVKFYGRVGSVNPATDFCIVALPDSQFYSDGSHGAQAAMWYSQMEWIITNRVSRNIVYVVHEGDISNHGDNNGGTPLNEWRVATNAMYRIENPVRTLLTHGIPYGMAVGNHDQSPNGSATGTSTYFNQYFGVPHFSGKPYWGGSYGTTNNNHFDLFSAGGMDFIVIYFEYDTGLKSGLANWANEVLRTNQNRRAIIVTHNFGNTATPVSFNSHGSAIYNAIKTNKNVFMMLAGHVTGEGSRADTYNGNTIRTFVSDYQGWTNGGSGFLRLIDFSPANNQVVFSTYSPWLDEFHTGPTSDVWFNYDMQSAIGSNGAPFTLIGTVTNVPSGEIASLVWSNREANTAYEWYAVVSDEANNTTTGPTWRFTTAPNTPPVANNFLAHIYGDSPTNLATIAFDANGDALEFITNTLPQHGYLVNFNTNSGEFTFVPVRGYRGSDRFTWHAADSDFSSSTVTFNFLIYAPPDTNANGLPDAWESTYGVSNANADDDGDGQSNLAEYLANTNPTNAASALRITSTTRDGSGHVTLTWPTVGGTRYRVQYSNGNLNSFSDVERPFNVEFDDAPYGSDSTQTFTDDFTLTGAPNGTRYYRIKVVQ